MKRPEYVAAAVTACRKALAHQEVDYHTLQSVFSRGGFTAGFFDGKRDARMFGVRSKEDVTAAASVLSTLANEAQKEYPRIPVDFSLTLQAGKPISLTATDGTHTTTVCGEPPALAQNKPTDAALVEKALRKLGGTFYLFGALHCTLEEGLMVPVSVLNDLRRRALQQLTDLRGTLVPYPFDVPHVERTPIESKSFAKSAPRLRVICTNKEQISTAMLEQCEYIALPIEEALTLEVTDTLRQKLMLTLPRVCFGDDISKLTPALTTLRERGICHLAVGHLGDIHLGKSLGFTLHGGCGLNITNSPALAAYAALGLCDSLLSFELNFPRARAITPTISKGILAYGYLPLMVTRTCPVGGKCASCNHKRQLIDRRGASFGILCTSSYCEILNGVPLYLADKPDEAAAFSFLSLLFTTETPAQCQDIFTQYATSHLPQQNTTRGLYTRNVL